MKHVGNELFSIIEKGRMVKKELAERIGITPVYFSAIMKKDSIDAELLERICKAVGISPAYFFDDYQGDSAYVDVESESSKMLRLENEMLKAMLAEKERTVKILMERQGL